MLMYQTYCDKLQPYFGEENIQSHYITSVTKDTPIIVKRKKSGKTLRVVESNKGEAWYRDNNVITQ